MLSGVTKNVSGQNSKNSNNQKKISLIVLYLVKKIVYSIKCFPALSL